MERISQRESVLLGYNFQRPFTNHPSSSPESQHGNSDVDFTDVFGGPPRRSSLQEVRYSFSETADSFASTSGDVDTKLSRNSLSGLNDKPVFGDENVNRRRYRNDGFFDDIFRVGESLSSSPRKHDRDSLSSTPGSRALSPAELMPHRADPWSPSLPAQFSLPAKLIKGTDLPTVISNARGHHKNKDSASNAISNYTYSSLSGSASQTNLVGEELTNDVSRQSALSKEQSLSSEESSNWTKPEETEKSTSWKRDSDGSEIPTNRNQFHFSIYKWATKGLPFAMPLRGANKSRLNEKCKLQRCSCEGIAGELHPATPHDIDTPSFSSRMGFDKQDDHFLFNTSLQGEVETCQIPEDTSFISELDTPSNLQVIVEDGPINSASGALKEIKHHSATETGLSWSRAVTIALGGRSRLGFINGKEAAPDSSSPEFDNWLAKDQMVMSWILNSMERNLAEMFSYYQSSLELWEAVKEMYGNQNNSARVFQIQQEIAGLHQNGQPFVQLLSKFKGLWNELDIYRPPTTDPLILRSRKEEDQIFQLLASLGSDYEDLRSHILMNDELPPLKGVCATIQREEIRRKVMTRENPTKMAEARAFAAQKNEEQTFKNAEKASFRGNRSNLKCNYCNAMGHQMDRCWILHPDLKPRNLGNRQTGNQRKSFKPRANVANLEPNYTSPMNLLNEFASFLQEKRFGGGEGSSAENNEGAALLSNFAGLTRGTTGLTRDSAADSAGDSAGLTRDSAGLTRDYAEKFQGPLHQTEDW